MFSQTHEAAPIDRAGLEATLRPFGESRMLPRAAYVDASVFAWEQEHFFGRGWVCVGLSEDVANPGDQRAESIGSSGVLLTRDNDGQVHGFANTCRHRGHELLTCGESAHSARITCPYHSWSYDLCGNLKAARGFQDADRFDPSANGLVELPAGEWAGLVFIDASVSGEPLHDRLATLQALVAPYEPDRLKVGGRHTYDARANWKILTENYQECYHCSTIHPQFCEISPPKSGANYVPDGGAWVGGWMEIREGMSTMSLDGTTEAVPLRGLSGESLHQVIYASIFPNVLLSLHPDYVMTHRLTPLAADRTRIDCTWSFAPESFDQSEFDPAFAIEFWDITNEQDWKACESVQRGLSSPHAIPGPLSQEEDAVYQLVTMIARGYLGAPVRNVSSPVTIS